MIHLTAISVVLSLPGLFSAAAFSPAIVAIVAQNLWVLAAALVLLARSASASKAPASA
jgi:biotin transporter BioY